MKRLLVMLLFGLCTHALGQPAKNDPPKLEVAVNRIHQDNLHLYEVDANGTVQASLATVWKTLTNYEKMNEFVPDMQSCRVLSRNGNEVIIEQFGTARFLFMSKSIHLIVRATEQPMTAIDIALISGDMKHYESRWELVALPEGGTRVVYSGKLVPNFYVPGILGTNIIRSDIERMMGAVLARIDKAEAAPTRN
ncbi:MAG: SRPBCC family protein [Burkholderiaceae bacterium]|nr:SRPBCC family protein [Burkholderiaceae bacterium]